MHRALPINYRFQTKAAVLAELVRAARQRAYRTGQPRSRGAPANPRQTKPCFSTAKPITVTSTAGRKAAKSQRTQDLVAAQAKAIVRIIVR